MTNESGVGAWMKTPAMRSAIGAALAALPASDSLDRARTAFYLVVTSPQYQVER